MSFERSTLRDRPAKGEGQPPADEPHRDKDRGGAGGRDDTIPLTPYVFIPFTADDHGDRPLTGGAPFWECKSILLDGEPADGSPLAGTPIDVSVVVANGGAVGTGVTLSVYWTDPTAVFSPAACHLVGQSTFVVPATAVRVSPALRWDPGSVPAHVCLIAEVTAVADPSPGTFDPVGDRHYAQQNLRVTSVPAGARVVHDFYVATPGSEAGEVHVVARPITYEAGALASLRAGFAGDATPSFIGIALLDDRDGAPAHRQRSIALRPGERRMCQLIFDVPTDVAPGTVVAVEITQTTCSRVGTLAVAAVVRG